MGRLVGIDHIARRYHGGRLVLPSVERGFAVELWLAAGDDAASG
jgi:hypothetical protein